MTGKVIWHMTMSMDGFIADQDDEVDWALGYGGPEELGNEVIRTTGAFMCGGRIIGDTKPYGGAWQGPIFVLTHKDPALAPEPLTFLSGDIRDCVDIGLKAADGKNLVVTGGSVPRQSIEAGLVDEIVLHVVPVLLGAGVRFFDSPGSPVVKLDVITANSGKFGAEFRLRVVR
ncbi:dihydrofolate reductase family protein [Kibdelosporangium aridum]|uniref:dihydrofolate reductase family protein n=1 Tax=Kibdelosporangium aridum TaxID=2030 RepID=UPI0007C44233